MVMRRKRLTEIVREVTGARYVSDANPEITSVEYDSRRVQPGSLFVAIPGLKTDGSVFTRDAEQRGAAAFLTPHSVPLSSTLPVVRVENARKALAEAAWAFFDHPEQQLICTGITGTNGKTTTASLLRSVLEYAGEETGLIGTLGVFYRDLADDSPRTTPESSDLAAYFANMRRVGCRHVVMEATSIGVDLERVWKIPFRIAVFTNLTRDHLDYHRTEAAYLAAKVRLFEELPKTSTGIVNTDDPAAENFLNAISGTKRTYSISRAADYQAKEVYLTRDSVRFILHSHNRNIPIQTPLIGRFNVYNILAVIAAADALGVPIERIQQALESTASVRGRAEIVALNAPFTVVVDYAHTPDALEKILSTLRALHPARMLTVIGAGGDRDKGKRPLMAEVSSRLSDLLILTSDNPRHEDPDAILNDLEAGISSGHAHEREVDRRKAIAMALREARAGDMVLIAGKGHETNQDIGGVKHPFDDRQVILEEFAKIGSNS